MAPFATCLLRSVASFVGLLLAFSPLPCWSESDISNWVELTSALTFFNVSFFQQDGSNLFSLPSNDNLFLDYSTSYPENVTRNGVVDTIDYYDAVDILVCHVVAMLPFFDADSSVLRSYEAAAAIALALQHLNTGNGTIVPEVESVRENNCPVLFGLEFLGTRLDPGRTIEMAFEISSRAFEGGTRRPCSFVGGIRSAVTIPTALLNSQRGLVQVSGSSTSAEVRPVGLCTTVSL